MYPGLVLRTMHKYYVPDSCGKSEIAPLCKWKEQQEKTKGEKYKFEKTWKRKRGKGKL